MKELLLVNVKMLCTTHPITQLAHTCTHESQWYHIGENSCSNEAPPFFLGGGGQIVLHYSSNGENDTTLQYECGDTLG